MSFLRSLIPAALRSRAPVAKNSGANVAILAVVAKILPRAKLEALLDEMTDRRFLIEEIARAKGVSVEQVLEECSYRAGIRAVRDLPPADVAVVVQNGRTLAEFRAAGSIPVTEGGAITAIACVDPMTVRTMLRLDLAVPFYLAPWSVISRALDLSVQQFAERERQTKAAKVERLRQLSRQAIEALVREVATYGRSAVSVIFEGASVHYEFTTTEGKRAHGTVHASIADPLEELLTKAVIEGGLTVATPREEGEVFRPPQHVTVRGDRSCFRLLWGRDATEVTPEKSLKLVEPSTARPGGGEREEKSTGSAQLTAGAGIAKETGSPLTDGALILIVDDNKTFGRVLERFFERHRCRTIYIESAQEALARLGTMDPRPDLLLCDVHMPGMTGIDLVSRVRSELKVEDLPVVMLTSDDDAETEITLISSGADAFVAKSEDPRVLWVHVKRLLEKQASRRAA